MNIKPLRIFVALWLGPLFLLPAPAETPDPWRAMESLFQATQIAPESTTRQTGKVYAEPKNYLFETYAALEPSDFRTGLVYVLDKYPAPSDPALLPAYERDLDYKLRVIFEYYPLSARGYDDFNALLDLLFQRKSSDILRVFLILQCAPDTGPRTTFGTYMQGHLAIAGESFDERLNELVQMPQESVPVQRAALDTLLARANFTYASLLSTDPVALSRVATDAPLHVRQLIDAPDAIPLSQRTKLLLERQNTAMSAWAKILKNLAESNNRDHRLREKAGAVLDSVLRDFPLADRDSLTSPLTPGE